MEEEQPILPFKDQRLEYDFMTAKLKVRGRSVTLSPIREELIF